MESFSPVIVQSLLLPARTTPASQNDLAVFFRPAFRSSSRNSSRGLKMCSLTPNGLLLGILLEVIHQMRNGMDTLIIMIGCSLRLYIIPLLHLPVLNALILAVPGWSSGFTMLVLERKYTLSQKM